MQVRDETQIEKYPPVNTPPWWTPRVWQGCSLGALIRLLAEGGFAVDITRWHVIFGSLPTSLANTLLGAVQQLVYGRRISRAAIRADPVFIIGHWRSGTTLLHELLCSDDRHAYPNTYQCVAPHHFLLTESIAQAAFKWLVPKRRAMDRMALGWSRPQEDEFALWSLGVPSPYHRIAFPNKPWGRREFFELEEFEPDALDRWKREFFRFLKSVTLLHDKRIVLKSPTHTFRIRFLLEHFADARFVHIVRNPYETFSSTIHNWRSLYLTQGLQFPNCRHLKQYVLETFERMHERLSEARNLFGANRFHEIRYEDLLADPVGQMRILYERLELEDFTQAEAPLKARLAQLAGYEPNRYALSPLDQDEITRRWGPIMGKYGYDIRN